MRFFRRKATRLTRVAKDKLERSQAADKPVSLLLRPLPPPQKGQGHLSQAVDDTQTVPIPVTDFDTNIDNKSSSVYLSSPPSTFLSPIVYKSRPDELATTDSFLSTSLRTTQTLPQNNINRSDSYSQETNLDIMTVVPTHVGSSAQDDMENWDEAFEFQPVSSEKDTTGPWTPTPANVRHKTNAASIPIPTNSTTTHSSSLPAKPENWDDSYVYEDDEDEDEDDISSLGNPRPAVPPILSSRRTGSVEDDVDSWGSGSDWSGDGDIEDLTRESFKDDTLSSSQGIPVDLERQPSTSTGASQPNKEKHSGIPRFGRFGAGRPSFSGAHIPSNVTPTKSDASSNVSGTSFLAKISPVHRWKSPTREGPTPKQSQPFQVSRQPNDSSTLSKHDKKERKKNDLSLKVAAITHDVKKQGSRTPLASSSQSQQQQRKDREKDQGKGKNAMSPIKRVFSGTPLSPKNASSSGSSKAHNASLPPSSSQTSSLSSVSVSAEAVQVGYERELPPRRNPPSAPASTMTSPTSKQSISSGARTKVRYRSKTTTSTTATSSRTSLLPPAPVQPLSPPSLTQNQPLSPPSTRSLAPRHLSQTPRRSSLNDLRLRIPERISHAQRDIKRDLSDVREFAACVEQLRNLQHVYAVMLRDLRAVLSEPVNQVVPSQANNGITILNLSPKKRRGTVSSATPQTSLLPSQSSPNKTHILKRKFSLAAPPPPQPNAYAIALNKLDGSYGIWWECAEVLIEMGGWRGGNGSGSVVGGDVVDVGSVSGNALVAGMITGRRVRAVTLGSDAGATVAGVNVANVNASSNSPSSATSTQSPGPRPPPASPPKPSQWRATTGRAGNGRDLTPRQLAILQDMMLTDDERDGRWDPRAFDSDRGGPIDSNSDGKSRNRKGLREFWSGFRKGGNTSASDSGNNAVNTNNPTSQITSSPTRHSTSFDSSSASESNTRINKDPFSPPDSKYDPGTGRTPRTPSPSKRTVTAANALSRGKKPPRRPSLAGLFGIGQKNAFNSNVNSSMTRTGGIGKNDGSSSDWDLMEADAAEVLTDVKPRKDKSVESASPSKPSTIRGRPTIVYDSSSSPDKKGSQATQKAKKPSLQLPRTPHLFLSSDDASGSGKGGNALQSPIRIHSEAIHSSGSTSGSGIPIAKLALTPDNIRPLLKHAREIAAHLNECIGEVRGMMGGVTMI